jgi:lipoprotein-anchoring transpeptidase ErfK/SrfK
MPWIDEGDVPLASWSRSVVPRPDQRNHPGDLVLFSGPNRGSPKRGVTASGATLPLFAAKRGGGCNGRWLLVGPLAWTCSDDATVGPDEPQVPPLVVRPDGLLRDYFFVPPQGASAYADVQLAQEGAPDRELEGGWGVAVVGQRTVGGQRWEQTSKGLWIAARDLGAARPSLFHGEKLEGGPVDLAWVVADKASVWPEPSPKAKTKESKARFEVVRVAEASGLYSRVGDGQWMLSRDLGRPHVAPPPSEVTRPGERWIDVELASQTLVAYEGTRPVYTTLVSTGRGAPGTDGATPPGTHRIWVKLLASDMDNVERDDLDAHYSLEDVPYVQFFDKAVALHGTYWHRDFGHVKSHGCVNLAPLDARWLFDFTGPHLPAGWAAAYPEATDPGTAVRVR